MSEPYNGRGWRFLTGGLLSGGNLRAAILGVNDGLVSNFILVVGVAGGTDDPTIVLLAGIAGLLAGAFSMAVGEYVSVGSQRDVYRFRIAAEAIQMRDFPDSAERELAAAYVSRGLTPDEARIAARRIMSDPEVALETKVREELGLDLRWLGSPLGAAASSFIAFVLGAVVPILPYLLDAGSFALTGSAVLSMAALALVGGAVAAGSGRSVVWGSVKMLCFGSLAAAVTFGIGRLVGVVIAG